MKRLVDVLAPGLRVWAPAMSNESTLLHQELLADPERARGVTFSSVQFPGIDRTDYLAIHPEARQLGWFMTPALRKGIGEGRADVIGLDYVGIARELREGPVFDVAIAQLTPPDADGWCAPGLSCDFVPLVWQRAGRRVAHINPALPRLDSSFRVHISQLDHIVEAEAALIDFADPVLGDTERAIGRHVATLVRDGDTLQFGIGGVPLSLGQALGNHRRLRFHGGMLPSALRTMWDAGAMDRDARMLTGVVLGDGPLREFAAALPHLYLADVGQTHDPERVAATERFIAVNGGIEVDLLGQVNAERTGGVIQAGSGGLPCYSQGAQRSPGGRLVTCLPSTARGGSVSRIVPAIADQALVTVPRYLTDAVVTEHGVAQVRGLGLNARAEALIAIADPAHRPALVEAWAQMRKKL
jgi:acyl-CoA hydrolase